MGLRVVYKFFVTSLLGLFFISCSTHRVIDLRKCSMGKVIFDEKAKLLKSEDIRLERYKVNVYGDGIEHPIEINSLKGKKSFKCHRVSRLVIKSEYKWDDFLISLIPFVSRKTLTIHSVTDGD